MEIDFPPELDEAFGVSFNKQGVRPIMSFWKALADEEIDGAVRREDNWHRGKRETLRKERQQLQFEATDSPSPASSARPRG